MDEGRIDRLKRGLYSRKAPDIIDPGRSEFTSDSNNQEINWKAPESSKFDVIASRVAHSANKHHSLAKKLFGFSLGVFILSLLIVVFIFIGGANRISSKNVDIKVVGPVSVGGGQETSFDIVVTNNNTIDLENVKLTIEYPKGSRKAGSLNVDLTNESFSLGSIISGRQATQPVSVYLFGEKDEIKSFKASVDYEIKNSNSKFFKEKQYEIFISSAPVIVTATYPKEINTNQEIEFRIEVVPNSPDSPNNFLVNLNYPFGFTFKDSVPEPTYSNNTWNLDNLRQNTKRTILVRGIMTGQNNEERVFKITAGTPNEDDPRQIGVVFVATDESMLVKRPFIGLDLRVAGLNNDVVVEANRNVENVLRVQNNTREQIFNVVVEANLSGPAFSNQGVNVGQNGFFRSFDNTVFWDKRAVVEFNALEPGESKDLTWSFSPLRYNNFSVGEKPEVYVSIKVFGERILTSGATERVESRENRIVRLATNLAINQKTFRAGNNINNTGPIPPRVNQNTTYTIVWSVSNTFNITSNVVAKAVLPPYVVWTGVKNPNNENITYNPDTHEVVWNIGTVSNGVGYTTPTRDVAFQVSFLPSVSQLNSDPVLVNEVSITGIDKVSGINVNSKTGAVTTRFSDSSFKTGDERVVQ